MSLIELAERCEAATGPNGNLNRDIACALGMLVKNGMDQTVFVGQGGRGSFSVPRYTASIDAAMTLVPEGSDWMLGRFDQVVGGERPSASVFWADGDLADEAAANAATPALALCAAALRARAALNHIQGDGQ